MRPRRGTDSARSFARGQLRVTFVLGAERTGKLPCSAETQRKRKRYSPSSASCVKLKLGIEKSLRKGSIVRGQCLCGRVSFEIFGKIPLLYQCHCSLCRKQSGAASSAATIVASENFRWLSGKELVSSWIKETGFRSDFCSKCGTPLPNPLRNLPYVWVPAGVLEDDKGLAIGMQVFVGSKAAWEPIPSAGVVYGTSPELLEFVRLLHLGEGN